MVISVLWGINLINYIHIGYLSMDGNNVFAFWYNILFLNLGQGVVLVSPILMLYSGLSTFYQNLKESNLQNHLLRQNYKTFFTKNLLQSYVKSCIPFLIASIIILIIGFCLLPTTITNDSMFSVVRFYMYDVNNPYLYLLFIHLLWFLFGSVIINIGLIVLYFVKRFALSIAFTFIVSHFINYGVGLLLTFVSKLINSQEFYVYASQYVFFEGFMIQSNFLNAYLHTFIYFILFLLIVIKLYSKKEKVVMNFA